MNRSMNKLINTEAVCRTAPATPGLLNMACFPKHFTQAQNNLSGGAGSVCDVYSPLSLSLV